MAVARGSQHAPLACSTHAPASPSSARLRLVCRPAAEQAALLGLAAAARVFFGERRALRHAACGARGRAGPRVHPVPGDTEASQPTAARAGRSARCVQALGSQETLREGVCTPCTPSPLLRPAACCPLSLPTLYALLSLMPARNVACWLLQVARGRACMQARLQLAHRPVDCSCGPAG